mgnify:CR=1 FL=1
MDLSFLTTALIAVSLLTNLTVEGLKKLMDERGMTYSSNLLAAVTSVIIAAAIFGGYMIMNDITFTIKIAVQIVVLMYLAFLSSTVGYDKIIQTLKQIKETK